MHVTRLACLLVAATLLGCGGGGGDGGTTQPPPPPPPPGNQQTLGSISTNVTTMNLVAGNTQTITVSAFDASGAVISSPATPVFTVLNTQIAEVEPSGAVLGLFLGSTVVNVSLTMGGVTRTATVTVNVTGVLPGAASVSTASGDVFTPNKVAISQGGSVAWSFGAVEHTVSFTATPGAPAGITTGGYLSTQNRTFNQPGNFSYICTIHAGMNGQVIVR